MKTLAFLTVTALALHTVIVRRRYHRAARAMGAYYVEAIKA